MSARRADAVAAELWAELEALRDEPDRVRRGQAAWQLLVRAGRHADFPVLLDFALEHGLVLNAGAAAPKGQAGPTQTWVNPVDGSEMICIPPGPFVVGPENQPAACAGFSLARYPVTNQQFRQFLEAARYAPLAGHPAPELFLAHWDHGRVPRGKEDHPVVWVSYIDALHYCRWAGLTLPTEWLWEKAARGPDGRAYPWGDQPSDKMITMLTNVRSQDTCPVGSFPRTRSAYGCEDMVGNVAEWCQPTAAGAEGAMPPVWPEIPAIAGAPVYGAVRGSCYLRVAFLAMRSWHRRRLSITRRNQWVGFRPALPLACRPAG